MNHASLTESSIEPLAISLLERLGYAYVYCPAMNPLTAFKVYEADPLPLGCYTWVREDWFKPKRRIPSIYLKYENSGSSKH